MEENSIESVESTGDTEGSDDIVLVSKVVGRPKGSKTKRVLGEILDNTSRSGSKVAHVLVPASDSPLASPTTSGTSSTTSTGIRTSDRTKIFLLNNKLDRFSSFKLPKCVAVLQRFIALKEELKSQKLAVRQTVSELKLVWRHHFGPKLVYGVESEGDPASEASKLVIMDDKIETKINNLYKEWQKLECESKRKDRISKTFDQRQKTFVEDTLENPMNIAKKNAKDIFEKSGIKDWEEDFKHFENQLKKAQIGTFGGIDLCQEKFEKQKAEEQRLQNIEQEMIFAPIEETNSDDGDTDYVEKDDKNKKKKKTDIMSRVSLTGDRLGLSIRQRTMYAATVCNAAELPIEDTNISKSTAWRHAKKQRLIKATDIKEKFEKPDHLTVHWDGKLMKMRAGITSERCCVYVSGAQENKNQKLLGVPDIPSGTGSAQEKAVTDLLEQWDIFDEIVGLVFDTTASNSGKWQGACSLIEKHLGKAVLWLSCRHHVYELHIKHVVEVVTGNTKDPGVSLFRRLKTFWNDMTINYDKLSKFDWSSSDTWLCEQAQIVLEWAMEQLKKKIFPRDDYKELLDLLIVWLGGPVENFTFKYPGADHHARWMSKQIYTLKIALLSDQIEICEVEEVEADEEADNETNRRRKKVKKFKSMKITTEEKTQMKDIVQFIGLFYAKAFLEAPLSSSAPNNDLKFMQDMQQYRDHNAKIADACLLSCGRHLWYLTPQLVVFSLADSSVSSAEREALAKTLFKTPREATVKCGKPVFPAIVLTELPKLCSLVSPKSWLLFDLLQLEGTQEWLQTPVQMWSMFSDFRKLETFILNVSVTNDLAERGIKLTSDFLHLCRDETQLQAVLQCVENHREMFPSYTKEVFSKLNC